MLKNQLLQQAHDAILTKVEDAEVVQRIVKAGTKVIYNQKLFPKLTQGLRASKDPAGDIARGMVGILKLMSHRARGTMPLRPLVQAGMALVLDALDFFEQAGLLKVDAAVLDTATEEYVEAVLPAIGMPHERMNQMLGQVKQVMADPQKMAAYQQSVGAKA